MWHRPRYIEINGRKTRVPFGLELPSLVADFIPRWIKNSGLSWTAKRIKRLKIWALRILAGTKNYHDPWIRHVRYKGIDIPRLELFKMLVNNLRVLPKVRLILTLLDSYKLVQVGRPSLDSINKTPLINRENLSIYVKRLRSYVTLPKVPPFALEGSEVVNTRKKFTDDTGVTYEGPYGTYDSESMNFMMLEEPAIIGRVIAIADKGKWRNILVGHKSIQLMTKKLADWLREWLWNQPEIASGDQSKMSRFIVESLKKRKTLLSIDLSEATDRLSRHFQVELLYSMGVPKGFFDFLELPFVYSGKEFLGTDCGTRKSYYSNGQPMGLFVSFPMFELAHYVILKYSCAVSDAQFCICGDDVVIAVKESEAKVVYDRYTNLICRLGGVISTDKTFTSLNFAEGIGAIFLKDYPFEIRIPHGKVSLVEALMKGTWLSRDILNEGMVGMAIANSWLETKLFKVYTTQQRTQANNYLITKDLSDYKIESLRALLAEDHYPTIYSIFDEDLFNFWRNTPEDETPVKYKWVSVRKYRSNRVSHKIVQLYKGLTYAQ
jgi:hypothetical protein